MDILVGYAMPQLPCDAWFRQNGASANFGNIILQFLNERFPNKRIGRGGFLAMPHRLPDQTLLDFFL
jgi:hypothetical protein